MFGILHRCCSMCVLPLLYRYYIFCDARMAGLLRDRPTTRLVLEVWYDMLKEINVHSLLVDTTAVAAFLWNRKCTTNREGQESRRILCVHNSRLAAALQPPTRHDRQADSVHLGTIIICIVC